MQEKWVWSLIREDPTCSEATKPMCHNYWTCALEPGSHSCWAPVPQWLKPASSRACALQQEKPPQGEAQALQLESSPCSPQLEKACMQHPTQPKKLNQLIKKKILFRWDGFKQALASCTKWAFNKFNQWINGNQSSICVRLKKVGLPWQLSW